MLSLRLTSGDSSMSAVIGLAGNWRIAVLKVNVRTSACRYAPRIRARGPGPIARNWPETAGISTQLFRPATQSNFGGRYKKDTCLANRGECVTITPVSIAVIEW